MVTMAVEFATESEDEHLSPLEIRIALHELSDADILRLGKIASQYANGCQLETDELLNEAIAASLSGNRQCPRTVPLIIFLRQAMRSIASNQRRKIRTEHRAEPMDNDPANDPVLSVSDGKPSPADRAVAEQEVQTIFALFDHDEDVTMLLMGIYDSYNPDEICETAGWDRKTYDTVRKRLRRGLNKHFPEGRQS